MATKKTALPEDPLLPAPRGMPERNAYRHGDLRRALLDAGVALARAGGPDAVVLRAATREAGVVPNAAYRHFASREDLLRAVRAVALSRVAAAMEAALAEIGSQSDALAAARAQVRAVGSGYLKFAHDEPGLFRTAFSAAGQVDMQPDPAKAGPGGLNPFELLGAALDALVGTGGLAKQERPGAEYLAWSAVHGLALLFAEGPLHAMPPAQRHVIAQRLLQMVEKGLSTAAIACPAPPEVPR